MVALTDFTFELALNATGSPRTTTTIAVDATSTAPTSAGASRTTMTWSHTVASGATLLTVATTYAGGGAVTTSTVTWNGAALTRYTRATSSAGVNNRLADLWYLVNPTSGTANIVVTQSGSNDCDAAAVSWLGTDTVTPFGTAVTSAAATGTTISLSPTGGSYVIAAASVRSTAALTVGGAPTTVLGRVTGASNNDSNAVTYKAVAYSPSFSWATGTDENAAFAVPINAAAYTDISSYLRVADGLTFTRGRQSEQTALASPGTGSLTLRNNDARFTPGNGSSPYAPVQLRRPMRFRTTYSATTYNRWLGFVDDWGNASDSNYGIARVQVSDRLARTVKNKFTYALDTEILQDKPTVYYSCTEGGTAISLVDRSGNGYAPIGLDGFLSAFGISSSFSLSGGATMGGADAQSMLTVTTSNAALSGYPAFGFTTSTATAEAVLYPTALPTATGNVVNLGNQLLFYINADGTVSGILGASVITLTSSMPIVGKLTHVALTLSISGGTATLTLYVNGAQVATGTAASAAVTFASSATIGYFNGSLGSIAAVAVYPNVLSAARILEHANGAVNGWSGESTNARFSRACRLAGLPAAAYGVLSASTIPMGAQPFAGRGLSDVLADIATVENGSIYVDKAGVLTFAPRTARYMQSSALTLDASKPGQVLSGAVPVTNDQYLINDSTITQNNASAWRYVDNTSIAAYDAKDEQQTIYTSTDAVASALAQWHVLSYKDPRARFDQPLEIDVVAFANSGGSVANLLNLEVGSKITVTNLPTHMVPTGSVSLFVEGVSDVLASDSYRIRLVTSPVALEDSVFAIDTSSIDGASLIAY